MQKLAVLVSQFAVAAAGKYVLESLYSEAGCAAGALKSERLITPASYVEKYGNDLKDYTWGTCLDQGIDMMYSEKFSCEAGAVAMEGYDASRTCEANKLIQSATFNCAAQNLVGARAGWEVAACDADGTGYKKVNMKEYKGNDCTGDTDRDEDTFEKFGQCRPTARHDGVKWMDSSVKATINGTVLTYEYFSTLDCSGAVELTHAYPCGKCEVATLYTCPPPEPTPAPPTPAPPDTFIGTAKRSYILPALVLLVVGAMTA